MPTVRVAVRSRPEQAEHTQHFSLLEDSGSIHLSVGGQRHEFFFDHVFSNTAKQEDVFNKCAVSICQDVLEGYNGSIFAYGQTGAGKTHTMSGPVDMEDYENDRGLCMRVASYLFTNSRKLPDTVTLRLSILEIYNEQLIDLLREPVASSSVHVQPVPKLSIVEIPEQGVLVPALYVMPLASEEDAFSFFLTAHRNRVVAEHQLNRNSSRSHVICTFYIDRVRHGLSQEKRSNYRKAAAMHMNNSNAATDADPEMIQSKVHLIDLAGSERSQKTGSRGVVQKEANYINKSLSFLEQVVVALTQVKREHIPYRQSKLTHLLKDSLGGNCHTCLVACVWPHLAHDWETLSTLRFSTRMKNIENAPVRNNLTAREPASAALVKQVNMLKRELILRDHISGVESYLPTLTFTQKATVMHQACELVSGRIPATAAVDPREYCVPFSIPEDMEIRSVSHAQQLVGTLRAAIWEACDGDSTLVSEVMARTSARLHASQQCPDVITTNAIESGGNNPLPRKEGWIYPSNFQEGEEKPALNNTSNQSSSGDLELPNLSAAAKTTIRPVSKSSLLSSHFKHGDAGNSTVAADTDAANSDVDGDGSAFGPNGTSVNSLERQASFDPFNGTIDTSTTGNTNGGTAVVHPDLASAEHEIASKFEAFKLGPGQALHETYDDIRRTVHLEKNRQREVISLLNRCKAEIDELMSSINVYQKEEKALLQDHVQTQQPVDEFCNASKESNDVSSDDHSEQLNSIQSVIAGMVNRLDAAKSEYRAAHIELQLCKQQIAETQILKKRAMNSIVNAYDKSTLFDQEKS